ncbi:MAG: hypothetical protein ACRD0K_17565 [Egibacteraceae bacterium]
MTATLIPRSSTKSRAGRSSPGWPRLACSCPHGNNAAGAAESWSFTDDRGVEVTLGSRRRRIVDYDTAASALWHLGLRPVGIFAGYPLAGNPNLAGLDLSGIESVGEVYVVTTPMLTGESICADGGGSNSCRTRL